LPRYYRTVITQHGYTLIELMIVLAIIATLAAIAVPNYQAFVDKSRISRAIADIKTISTELDTLRISGDPLPNSLAEVGYGNHRDPWGNPYQYLNLATLQGNGKARKNQFLVPLNSDYDLYSMGKDGDSESPLKARASRDDILRANDGAFVGLAATY
jgi:general secretion pathway protein G